ncbi:MAG: shikimate kinase [Lachnospiraceae bacterium]|nr:shikimate kinase [Lachnospiraceae bacterium]
MHHIILIGFMGCGKTTIGKALSAYYQWEIIDTDKLIEDMQKQSVSEIFAEHGEEFFRRLETEVLEKLDKELNKPCIIATGGGLPLCEENRRLLKKMGDVVYLNVDAGIVYQRLKNDTTRPLLATSDPQLKINEMLAKRMPVYEQTASFIIDTNNKTITEINKEISGKINSIKFETT